MDNNNRIIEQIEKIKQIKRGESLVIFVGAGVSKNSGVCSWGELVKEDISYLRLERKIKIDLFQYF